MAFNNVRREMSRALDRANEINETKQVDLDSVKKVSKRSDDVKPTQSNEDKISFEKTRAYQFTLQPSVREKIEELAKKDGARSVSSYLNEYFKRL